MSKGWLSPESWCHPQLVTTSPAAQAPFTGGQVYALLQLLVVAGKTKMLEILPAHKVIYFFSFLSVLDYEDGCFTQFILLPFPVMC